MFNSKKNQELIDMKLERKMKLNKPYDVKALKLGKTLFPFFLKLIKIKRIISGGKINIINNNYHNKNEKPAIFAITHVGKYDIERAYEALNEHSILLFGTPEDVHGTFDGFMLEKLLVNYLDTNDKEDRKVVKHQMIKDLKNGANIMWFPEGTWNISPNLLVLPMRYGIIEVALEANVPIVPVALEYDLYNKIYYINIGKNFYANKYSNKIDAITVLRDTLATLKWEIFESLSLINRKDIDSNYWDNYTNILANEWHNVDFKREEKYIFNNELLYSTEIAFNHLQNITPSLQTAFLFNKNTTI